MRKAKPWILHFRRALAAPGNLLAGAGAVLVAAVTWNPLPLILYGLGEPVWLYRATASARYAGALRDDRKQAAADAARRALAWREHQLGYLLFATPCGAWTRRGRLPDYAAAYARLVAMRDQTAHVIAARHDAANELEQDIVARMDDMLRAYLMMAKERLLFHCALAKIYPQLPGEARPLTRLDRLQRALVAPAAEAAPVEWTAETPFVSLDDARREVRDKLDGFTRDTARAPDQEEVYKPILEVLTRRHAELEARGRHDQTMAAQLRVFPDQFEIILGKLATTQADVSEVVGDMKLLLEQTDDTVRFAEDTRAAERPSAISN
jgi:hypothetical protein